MDKNIDRDTVGMRDSAREIDRICSSVQERTYGLMQYCGECGEKDSSRQLLSALDVVLKNCDKILLYTQFGFDLAEKIRKSCDMLEETDTISQNWNKDH